MNGLLYCDLCSQAGALITQATYDGKTRVGPWAFMCDSCFEKWGIGLGKGKGQRLAMEESDDSRF